MPQNKPWLIIAHSGRALAVSAAKAGIKTCVIDLFVDLETLAVTKEARLVKSRNTGFDVCDLLDILAGYTSVSVAGVVTGSGLEGHTEVLEYISQHWSISGNDADTVRACKDPTSFFNLLDKLHIAHPPVFFDKNMIDGDWLLKQSGSSGGGHILKYTSGDELPAGAYIQKKIAGRSMSVVFLADCANCHIAGINEIWPVAADKHDYRYLGAVTLPEVAPELYRNLEQITFTLVQELKLKGLCGMDVIVDKNNQCQVLEINPRPTATFELHEHDNSLFQAHIMACNGELVAVKTKSTISARAHKVIYATRDFRLPEFPWPSWTSDRPVAGKLLSAGEPVCTIHAEAVNEQYAVDLLETNTQVLEGLLGIHRLAA